MNIMKLAGEIVGGALSNTMQSIKNGSKSDTATKFYSPIKGNKITHLSTHMPHFLIVKIPSGSVKLK